MNNLRGVLKVLKSEKIKERQEALNSIRTTFANDNVVQNFHITEDSESDTRGWLVVFQALFQCVRIEKLALVKATSKASKSASTPAAAQRRLEDAAKVVRWLTERATRHINAKVLTALFDHLTQMMVNQGQLLKPVALDYIKALKYLASYGPHLDHMDDQTWIRCTEICFNIILGEPVQTSFGDDEGSEDSADDDELALDSQASDADELPAASNLKKRPRAASSRPSSSQRPRSPLRPRSRRHRQQISVSLEQVECASFLSILLRSSTSPLISQNHSYLPNAILSRLKKFLEMYPGESSLLPDYLLSVSLALRDLSLNRVREVRRFARSTWDGLVALWGMKDRRLKEYLVIVLRALLPFINSDDSVYVERESSRDTFNLAEGLGRLWALLDGEADNRWGVNGLNLECLRLELQDPKSPSSLEIGDNPFVANTFRSGWNFDSEQALSWAILDLQADCAKTLFQLSECMHTSTPSRSEKRIKLENPLISLLSSIQTKGVAHIRSYHLQILLFFIDRHWSIVHVSLKQDVINTLLQFVTFDDGDIQSWVFLNFAAIAFAQRSTLVEQENTSSILSTTLPFMDPANWDPIWTHAVRRANVPHICRSACHAAHTLIVSLHHLSNGQSYLTSQRVLLEVETLAKDMDVQGPSYPFDSVCMFLAECLRLAGQDVRLYRMQLEEKVLNWLVDTWTVTGMDRGKMSLHSVKDVMLLLESICGVTKRSDLVSRPLLPQCPLADSMIGEQKVKVIADFLLYAKLPSDSTITPGKARPAIPELSTTSSSTDTQLPPRGRERRISSFLQKMLDSLLMEWESMCSSRLHPTAEVARQSVDLAITAISFESVLVLNGTSPNKRLIQTSGKILVSVLSYFKMSRWTAVEKSVVALGLETLVLTDVKQGERGWHAMVSLDALNDSTPVLTDAHLGPLNSSYRSNDKTTFLRTIWKNPDLQGTLAELTNQILGNLTDSTKGQAYTLGDGQAMEVDDKDGFGPIRTMAAHSAPSNGAVEENEPSLLLFRVYITFLTRGPLLQSSSGQATRDKDLVKLIMGSIEHDSRRFVLTSSVLLEEIQLGTLDFNANQFDSMLEAIGDQLLPAYTFARDERTQLLVIQLLHATLKLWAVHDNALGETGLRVSSLCHWLSKAVSKQKIKSWAIRDAFALFLDSYLSVDPTQQSWSEEASSEEKAPLQLIQKLATDDDVRVRFRIIVDIARLFVTAHDIGIDLPSLYDKIKHSFCEDVENYEQILTRLLSLGNIMIVSSAARRGPYWHLLETCVHSSLFSHHIEAILTSVAKRLEMASLSTLFEAYASQLAYSIFLKDADFLSFPPRLLGYRDRKRCAEASFRAFAPTYILMGADSQFENHCIVLQKKPIDGLRECFGDITGIYIAKWCNEHNDGSEEVMETNLKGFLRNQDSFEVDLRQHLDSVIASILRTLSDQNFSGDGPIGNALRSMKQQGKPLQAFMSLVRHRNVADFHAHHPNLPAFGSLTVLHSLAWLAARLPDAFTPATTYHVLHDLLAEINRTPLMNEKMRLINALSLWVAMRNEDFKDVTLLYTLIHGATMFLVQPSLARAAQSILEWTLRYYRVLKAQDTRLSSILIRICCISYDYTLNIEDKNIAKLGHELLSWIDEQTFMLGKLPIFKNTVLRALPAWPSQPSHQLSELYDGAPSDNLATILTDHRISFNKFRVVRRLRDQVVSEHYDEDEFAKSDFWRLKECIPTDNRLQGEDITAFADLLTVNRGRIDNLSAELPVMNSLRSRHRRNSKRKHSSDTEYAPASRDAIIYGLLNLLEEESPSLVHTAYTTLRLIMSVLPQDITQLSTWAPEYRVELDYLQTYPQNPARRPSHDLADLLSSEQYTESSSSFSEWIVKLSVLLSDILAAKDQIFGQLHSILSADIVFGEQMLPVLVLALLQIARQDRSAHLSYKEILSRYFTQVLQFKNAAVSSLKTIVEIVLHLRYFDPRTNDWLGYSKWLDIDLHLLAQSAIRCGAYTTALLFLELAAEPDYQPEPDTKVNTTEQILYEIYAHIDEPDGFYGIRTEDLHCFLIKRLHHEKQWDKAFRFHGAALEAGNSRLEEAEGLLNSFHSFGFDQLAINTLQNSWGNPIHKESSSAMSYRLGWRTETWDLPDCEGYIPGAPLYAALRAIYRERDSKSIDGHIRSALYKEMSRMRSLGVESVAEIREVAQQLMCLNQILQWRSTPVAQRLHSKCVDLDKWRDFTNIDGGFEFSAVENIMAVRMALVRSVRQREERHQIGTMKTPFVEGLLELEKQTLLRLSEAARGSNQIQIALNSVIRAQRLDKVTSFDVSQEYANVLWLLKEEKLGVQFLRSLIQQDALTCSSPPHVRAFLLARLGTWTSEACLEKPTEIWRCFFDPAVTLLEDLTLDGEHAKIATVYHECAIFADRQYHATLQSSDAVRWKVYVDRKKQEIHDRQLELTKSLSDSDRRQRLEGDQKQAKRLLQADSELFRKHNTARDEFLRQAMEMHSRCLHASDTFDDDAAIRFCSLWFANFDDEGTVEETARKALHRIPSRKLVFLAHQLTARLAKTSTPQRLKNQDNLQDLILRMCQEHPFHSLYQVYCLQADKNPSSNSRRQSGRLTQPSTQTERTAAAEDLLDRLRNDDVSGNRVRNVERLCDACLQWAKHPIVNDPRYRQKPIHPFKIPEDLLIRRISKLQVPVPTAETKVDPTMRYTDCIWVEKYDSTFQTAGGVNLPKITVCYGSDGSKYKQLFKGEGKDDLRQDAVMEQVFDLVNKVLLRDRETSRRTLRVRGYKVIPLGTQAGLLEFVGNTSPLRDWLFSKHPAYRPQDIKPQDGTNRLKKVQKEHPHNGEEQLKAFLDVRSKFKPILRHYFTEKHKNPMAWFAMRLGYTRSVATTSIVGHVLGLGDRHTSNILMHNSTGEVVHIDLGIAFDQGKLLPIPERVPFRLTADIIDGMGSSGTQGVFQRCAEETLRVLREGSEVIMTVLEVFKHDPLHSWTASEIKVRHAQQDVPSVTTLNDTNRFNLGIGIDMSSGTAEEAADRALSSVARKLDKSLSVESTVNELIAEATDPLNLATIFYGWSPHV